MAIVFMATLFESAVAKSESILGLGISNFGRLNENYYRGAQPDRAGFDALKRIGVKTIIDLQGDGPHDEANWVREAGLRYFNIPLSSTRPATAAQTTYFLKLVSDPVNWPVYVHCAGGRHRTGVMTAIYRITHDSWSADRAYQEMKDYKFYTFGGHGSLKQYVYDYYESLKKSLAAAPSPSNLTPTKDMPASVNGD